MLGANISTKMLVTHSHFRDVHPDFARLDALGCCGSNSAVFYVLKIRPCFLGEFSVSLSVLPRSFFLLFAECEAFTHFFFFLSRKKEEKREIYIKRNIKEKYKNLLK
ncbi:MAG: hypothetical protein IJV70_05210 [Clostridia bacterium]|nr:hypothetical protein [Clostridia bacterium]